MRAEQNLPQSLASKESGLRALHLYFFQFLPPFAFEFAFGKGSFARQFIHQSEQRLSKFRQAGKGNRTSVCSGAGREVGTNAAQIFLDLAAGAFRSSGSNDRRGHFRKSWRAIPQRRRYRSEKRVRHEISEWNGLPQG